MTIAELIQKLDQANVPLSYLQIACLYSQDTYNDLSQHVWVFPDGSKGIFDESAQTCPNCDHQKTGFRVIPEEAVEVLTYDKIKRAREFFYKYPNDEEEEEEEDEEVK